MVVFKCGFCGGDNFGAGYLRATFIFLVHPAGCVFGGSGRLFWRFLGLTLYYLSETLRRGQLATTSNARLVSRYYNGYVTIYVLTSSGGTVTHLVVSYGGYAGTAVFLRGTVSTVSYYVHVGTILGRCYVIHVDEGLYGLVVRGH